MQFKKQNVGFFNETHVQLCLCLGMDFHELLEIPQGDRRKYHDDVSVIVISLEGRIWRSSMWILFKKTIWQKKHYKSCEETDSLNLDFFFSSEFLLSICFSSNQIFSLVKNDI